MAKKETRAGVKVTIDNGVTPSFGAAAEGKYIAAPFLDITAENSLSLYHWIHLHMSQGHSSLLVKPFPPR